jgi:hypothetical protein
LRKRLKWGILQVKWRVHEQGAKAAIDIPENTRKKIERLAGVPVKIYCFSILLDLLLLFLLLLYIFSTASYRQKPPAFYSPS